MPPLTAGDLETPLDKFDRGTCSPAELAFIERWYASLDREPSATTFADAQHQERIKNEIRAAISQTIRNNARTRPVPRQAVWARSSHVPVGTDGDCSRLVADPAK